MNQPGNTTNDTIEPVCPSYLVELSVVTSSGQEAVGDDMKNFAEQLKPYPCIGPQTKTHVIDFYFVHVFGSGMELYLGLCRYH